MEVKGGYFYTKEHEWVKIEGGSAVVGVSDYAQHKLGDITFVDLPEEGKEVKQFEVLAGLESVKAASDIYAPVSGKVTGLNTELENAPEKINNSPYEEGWIVKMDSVTPGETKELMDSGAYKEFLKGLE